MTHKEALELRALVSIETGSNLDVRVRVIGNGEHVVLINGFFFLWCESDWQKNKRKLLPIGKRVKRLH